MSIKIEIRKLNVSKLWSKVIEDVKTCALFFSFSNQNKFIKTENECNREWMNQKGANLCKIHYLHFDKKG